MAGRAEVGVGLTLADGRGLERRVKHCHTEADDDEVSLVVVRVELEHKVADDGVVEGEVELEVAVSGGGGRVKV